MNHNNSHKQRPEQWKEIELRAVSINDQESYSLGKDDFILIYQNCDNNFFSPQGSIFNQDGISIVRSIYTCEYIASGYLRLFNVNATDITTIIAKYLNNSGQITFGIRSNHWLRMVLFPDMSQICVNLKDIEYITSQKKKYLQYQTCRYPYCNNLQCGIIGIRQNKENKNIGKTSKYTMNNFLTDFSKLNVKSNQHVSFANPSSFIKNVHNGLMLNKVQTVYLNVRREIEYGTSSCVLGMNHNNHLKELSIEDPETGEDDVWFIDTIVLKFDPKLKTLQFFARVNEYDNESGKVILTRDLLIGKNDSEKEEGIFKKGTVYLWKDYDYVLGFTCIGCPKQAAGKESLYTAFAE